MKKYICNQCGKEHSLELENSNFCGNCCAPTPSYKRIHEELFERTRIRKELDESKRQFLKGEYAASARTATIILENVVKDYIGSDSLFGQDLMAQAFSFTYDQTSSKVQKDPLIKLNNLDSKTKRNEQDGMKFLCMGIMAGCRNIFAHSIGHASPSDCLSIIMMCNFIIRQIKEESLAEQLGKKL